MWAARPIKTFAKRPGTSLSIHKATFTDGKPTTKEINKLVEDFGLNEDARAKLESLPRKVFEVVKKNFKTPEGCDNTSGMLIGFAASVGNRLGFTPKKGTGRGGQTSSKSEGKGKGEGKSKEHSFTPKGVGKGKPTEKKTGKGRRPANVKERIDTFVATWALYPKCNLQLQQLPEAVQAFTLNHFRSNSEHEAEINSHFQEFVKELKALASSTMDEELFVVEEPYVTEGPTAAAAEEFDSTQIVDFCNLYNLNADARGKLETLNARDLETVIREFVLPEGVTECNGIVINFSNAVMKKTKGKGKGKARGKGKGKKRPRQE
eukprot:GEMP01043398.1.p1 GENE.GEMP01043398.1~~GEMP01043398.1.p1  ORF type:complete len:320 (+),score=69.77 GEMP01043398.1:39-998(+)